MKVKIERIRYAQVWNSEFSTLYGQTVGVCEKHNITGLHLEKSYGELVSFRPAVTSLTVYLRKNEKLSLAGKREVERDRLLGAVRHVVDGFADADLPETRAHYEVLAALLDKHTVKTIAAASLAAETERLQRLETDINADAAVQAAFAAFGLTPVVARLFAANREYDAAFRSYIAEKSTEEHIDVALLRRNCSKALVQFFDAVQYSAYINEDLNYLPLVNELNELNLYYVRQLKARAARHKNGSKTDEEQPIPPMSN
jgi:hypothetical protein